jgi:hypothetical protein
VCFSLSLSLSLSSAAIFLFSKKILIKSKTQFNSPSCVFPPSGLTVAKCSKNFSPLFRFENFATENINSSFSEKDYEKYYRSEVK